MAGDPPAGWFEDPERPGLRYWDGSGWTQHRHSQPPRASSRSAVGAATPLESFKLLPAPHRAALLLAFAAVAGMVIGTFGPWAHALFASKSGIESDGAPVLPSAVVAAGALWLYLGRRTAVRAGVAANLGIAAAAIAVIGLVRIEHQSIAIIGVHVADPAWGVYLTIVSSAALAVAAGCLALFATRESRAE